MGSGKADDKGNVVKPALSVGDIVLYQKYACTEFQVRNAYVQECMSARRLMPCFPSHIAL